ncbi:glycosyltransferase family 2 protein [Rhodobacteraceae bacterium NNCM2]|nr:glycosyltransferase family 2 protein [Coraliihabitans acroporae]
MTDDPALVRQVSPDEAKRPAPTDESVIGAIVVTHGSDDVIRDCLSSLLASTGAEIRIAVVDNASRDDTVGRVRALASERSVDFAEMDASAVHADDTQRPATLSLIHAQGNLGYAGGVNLGLSLMMKDPQIGLFWLVNPDCKVTPGAAAALTAKAATVGRFSLMGGRVIYSEPPNRIQSEGGNVGRWTGVCRSYNQGLLPEAADPPNASDLDFISGACLVASREFVGQAGLMRENYFLYYEEVDWAFRRGDLPLAVCSEAVVYHDGGTSIGSGSITRRASPFANFFNYRSRVRFLWRFRRSALPGAFLYALAKILQLTLKREFCAAWAIVAGTLQMPPPAAIKRRLSGDP